MRKLLIVIITATIVNFEELATARPRLLDTLATSLNDLDTAQIRSLSPGGVRQAPCLPQLNVQLSEEQLSAKLKPAVSQMRMHRDNARALRTGLGPICTKEAVTDPNRWTLYQV